MESTDLASDNEFEVLFRFTQFVFALKTVRAVYLSPNVSGCYPQINVKINNEVGSSSRIHDVYLYNTIYHVVDQYHHDHHVSKT